MSFLPWLNKVYPILSYPNGYEDKTRNGYEDKTRSGYEEDFDSLLEGNCRIH